MNGAAKDDGPREAARVDRWLWAVRLYKTRTAATSACDGGHVRLNGRTAKPSARARIGNRIEAYAGGRSRVVDIVRLIDKRVSAPVAATCLVDLSPPAPTREPPSRTFTREPGSGRPTKRERRQLDRFRP